MHRLAVEVEQWMNDRQFSDMYALSQLSPGPNVIIVTLIGYHVAGVAGALVATAAMTGPTCLFAFWIAGVWQRFKDAHWRNAIQAGLVPLSIGFMAASAYVVTRAADISYVAAALTAVVAVLMHFTRINPLLLLAGGGAIGLAGLL
jgi:chromate transporter